MKRFLKLLAAVLMAVYVGDLLLKKFFMSDFYREYALSEVGAYLFLFFAVGCFLLGIMRFGDDKDRR